MKQSLITMAAIMLLSVPTSAATVSSPDGHVSVDVAVADGSLQYSVSLDGEPLLEDSPLGLVTSAGDFSKGLRSVKESPVTSVRDEYELRVGKQRHVTYEAQRGAVTVENDAGGRLSVVVQVSDDGVALAYRLHGEAADSVAVEKEITGFQLPAGSTGFLHPMHRARSGWMRTNPSYEALYSIDRPVGEPSSDGQGWCFPALFRIGEKGWVLVSETGVDGHFCGSHLAHKSPGGLYTIAFPQAGENRPTDPIEPTVAGDAQTPWRTIVVGKTLGPIVESTLATDLVQPNYELTFDARPGRASWSWVFLKDELQHANDVQFRFIDMASELGWEYVLIDAFWDREIGREKMAEMVKYAAERNVGVLLWYNSNGPWNDAPQSPKDRMYDPEVRAEEMAWLREIGVKGLKVDFFGGDKQGGMQFYDDLLRDAAKYGLAMNFHGTTLPRGWQRMYPNYLTNEAVMGMEFCTFSQNGANHEPEHCSVLPFTRNVVGPMDFTPVILSERLGPGRRSPRRRTTDAFELALPVMFFSGIQHFGVTPDQVAAQPEFVREYFRAVPTTWDETRFLDGYPGRFAALARRSGRTWYIAAINGEDSPRDVALPNDLMAPDGGSWTLLRDGETGVVRQTVEAPDDGQPLTISLGTHGGAVLWASGPQR